MPARTGVVQYVGVTQGAFTASVAAQPPRRLSAGASLVVAAGRPLTLDGAANGPSSPPVGVLLEAPHDAIRHLAAQLPPPPEAPLPPPAPAEGPALFLSTPAGLHHTLQALAAHDPAPPTGPVLLDLMVTQVLVHLLETPARPLLLPPEETPSSGLAAALQYLRRHLHRPPSVDDLAEQACMSRSTFYRRFRDALGVTPLQHITRLRIERACALLQSPIRTVTDVSLALGFGSVSHFIDTFKRHVGTTPKAYQHSLHS
jgi:AraC-like DNA-binding protein